MGKNYNEKKKRKKGTDDSIVNASNMELQRNKESNE